MVGVCPKETEDVGTISAVFSYSKPSYTAAYDIQQLAIVI
jgi:hypothetical protein